MAAANRPSWTSWPAWPAWPLGQERANAFNCKAKCCSQIGIMRTRGLASEITLHLAAPKRANGVFMLPGNVRNFASCQITNFAVPQEMAKNRKKKKNGKRKQIIRYVNKKWNSLDLPAPPTRS